MKKKPPAPPRQGLLWGGGVDPTPLHRPGVAGEKFIDRLRRDVLAKAGGHGTRCPVCRKRVRIYQRRMSTSAVRTLIHLYHYYQQPNVNPLEYVKLSDYIQHLFDSRKIKNIAGLMGGDFVKLRHGPNWGFIEAKPGLRKDGSPKNGYYRMTTRGGQFVRGEIVVPLKVHELLERVVGWSEETIDVRDALKYKGFDYAELMQVPVANDNGDE